MIRWLEKEHELNRLSDLFEILYRNMESIAPMGEDYEAEKEAWVTCITRALSKAPRQILLIFVGDDLAGFCMYYIREDLLMVEELQLKPAYQKTVLAAEIFRFLRRNLFQKVRWIEAYADRRNLQSRALMEKLGMVMLEEPEESDFVHFRGAQQKYRE